jgi:hypothetical protein
LSNFPLPLLMLVATVHPKGVADQSLSPMPIRLYHHPHRVEVEISYVM